MSLLPRIFLPDDAAALAADAQAVALAIRKEAARRSFPLEMVRTGSRGMLWLEPLLEVETPQGRVAYGPVTSADIPGLFDADWLHGGEHPLKLGRTEDLPYLKNQERLTFSRTGVINPLSLHDYRAHGGLAGLEKALRMSPADIVQTVIDSGLRGRGGAAFPTGLKWRTVLQATSDTKYIVCNADEGDSGTFSDRLLMEGDPYALLEGMAIAALATRATEGVIYVRSEYPHAVQKLQKAVELARADGWLGHKSTTGFDIQVRTGAGAYICGEETALLESLEGKRGQVRSKPPLPALKGLFGCPTVVNNVVSLASVPIVLAQGAQHYQNFGMGKSRGTLAFQLAGNIRRGGLVEKAFGVTLRELLFDYGGGSATGRPLKAVQVGGPLGAWLPESQWDTPLDYEAFAAHGAMIGHGGIVAFDDTVDMSAMARHAMAFCAVESCGKCTPCRVGSVRGVEVIDRIRQNQDRTNNLTLLRDLCETMVDGSLCAMGGMTPYPVLSALQHFPEDFGVTPADIKP
jgi:formate dehydrogenase iron-sulfur subunit